MKHLLLFIPLLYSIQSAACCCTGYPTAVKEKLETSDVVMVAELVVAKPIEYEVYIKKRKTVKHTKYKCFFKVYTFYKGAARSRMVTVYNDDPEACGALFQLGQRYIIYANYKEKGTADSFVDTEQYIYTNSCKHNWRVDEKEIALIEQYTKPQKQWLQ